MRAICSIAARGKEKFKYRLIQTTPIIIARIEGTAESAKQKGSQDE
jgi:hypothetical protein